MKGKRLLLHEDNRVVMRVLPHLTLRSHATISELRKLFLLTVEHDISITTKYIRNVANAWAYRQSGETDNADWQLSIRIFHYYNKEWEPHSVDRFASFANT